MKIIADTNVYYYFADGGKSTLEQYTRYPISPTFINIAEFSKTANIVDNEEHTRNAVRSMFKFKGQVIYSPPFLFIPSLKGCNVFNPEKIQPLLDFTSSFAAGEKVIPGKEDAFKNWAESINEQFRFGAERVNILAEQIRIKIGKNKKTHIAQDTIESTCECINYFVKLATEGKCDLQEFDFNKIELLVKVLDLFFKKLETTSMKISVNDWYDFSIMAYVQPGDKYWTFEKRWRVLIKDAGCEKYLMKF